MAAVLGKVTGNVYFQIVNDMLKWATTFYSFEVLLVE